MLRSGDRACAIVEGKFLDLGDLHRITYGGTNYVFRLRQVTRNDRCVRDPVFEAEQKTEPQSTLVTS